VRFIFKFLLPLVFVISGAAALLACNEFESFNKTTIESQDATFEIKKGSNIRRVARALQNKNILTQQGYIEPKWLFIGLAKQQKQENTIKAGEYQLKQGMTPKQLLDLFSSGKTLQYQTRIPEGFTFKQIIKIIKTDKHLKQTLSDDEYENIMSKLETPYKKHKPEGWFLPDTYSYPRNTSDLQFLQRSHDAMLKELDKHWENRKVFKGINTPYDALILSSIIEKETGAPEDRGKVARTFINRLNINMKLQTDPTVIKAISEKNF